MYYKVRCLKKNCGASFGKIARCGGLTPQRERYGLSNSGNGKRLSRLKGHWRGQMNNHPLHRRFERGENGFTAGRHLHGFRPGRRVDVQALDGKLSFRHRQCVLLRLALAGLCQLSPPFRTGEARLEVVRCLSRREPKVLRRTVVLIAAESQQDGPGGHGTRVVSAAFDLVPGTARDRRARPAVVAISRSLGNRQPLFHHALIEHMARHLVFDSRPDFVRIEHHVGRSSAFGPRADDQPLALRAGKRPWTVLPTGQVGLETVL